MKVLNIFNRYVARGGEERAVEDITESLSHIVAVDRCDFSSADWSRPNGPPAWRQALWMIRNPASLEAIRNHHLTFKPDVWLVHNVFPVASAAVYLQAKQFNVPVIQYLHNFRPFSVSGYLWAGDHLAPGGLTRNYWEEIRHGAWQDSRLKTTWLACVLWLMHLRRVWQSVRVWIAISDFVREKFISAGVPANRIFTLRHFWRPQPQQMSDGQHYVFLGRLIQAKGILCLLDAWELLEGRNGAKTPRLVIAGDGPLREVVRDRAAKLNSVTFVGEISGEAKDQALKAARALIVPSIWWEPLGLVVYEAYEYSKPVLAAGSGGLSEIVVNGQTGFLHTPGNVEQLATQVMQLEGDAHQRVIMGQNGRVWLEQNTDEGAWREKFVQIAGRALNIRQ